VYEFIGQDERVIVAWVYPSGIRVIPTSGLLADTKPADIIGIVDPVGAPVSYSENSLRISTEPIFIRTKLTRTSTDKP